MLTVSEPMRFSEYFKLGISGDKLEFVDIYAYQDIPLFLDPYGISNMRTPWSRSCEEYITGFFQYLIDSINVGDRKAITKLINALHEVNEVALGYSVDEPGGRGIGPVQGQEILTAFENSEAAKSGDIRDIADCALMIPGINRDKISDITANILKKKLVEFTAGICKKYKIPTKQVPVNNAFDYETLSFISYYADLPVINGRPKILLPKKSVRRNPQLSKDKYYRDFVLEFLRAEHEHAGDSLATMLKNGTLVVRIKDLKERFPLTTDFLYNFSKEHPGVLEKYKEALRTSAGRDTVPILPTIRKQLSAAQRVEIMKDIKPGKEEAGRFHKLSADNLSHIMGDRLVDPSIEERINDGRKRIDIKFNNADERGFFRDLNALYHVQCPKIFVECKNYKEDPKNPEIDQLLGRFSPRRGMFGILICRSVEDKQLLLQRRRDAVHENKGFIIVLDDTDIENLLKMRDVTDEPGIDAFLKAKFDQLIM